MSFWTIFWSTKYFLSAQIVLLAVLVLTGLAVAQIHKRDKEDVSRTLGEKIMIELPTKSVNRKVPPPFIQLY